MPTTALDFVGTFPAGTDELTADFGFIISPTAVELVSFDAVEAAGGVLVTWETAVELENLGFNVYRSATEAGERTQVNPQLILGAGSSAGRPYDLFDATAVPGATYYYWLEDLDWSFQSTVHGPAIVGQRAAATVIGTLATDLAGIYAVSVEDVDRTGFRVDGAEVASAALDGLVLFYLPAAGAEVEILDRVEPLRMTVLPSAPVDEGNVSVAELNADGTLSLVTAANGETLLVTGFVGVPVVLDVTDPMNPVLIEGAILPGETESATYFTIGGDRDLEAADLILE